VVKKFDKMYWKKRRQFNYETEIGGAFQFCSKKTICRKAPSWGHAKHKGAYYEDVFESMAPHFGNVPLPLALSSIIRHKNECHHEHNHICIRKLRRGGFLVLTPIP